MATALKNQRIRCPQFFGCATHPLRNGATVECTGCLRGLGAGAGADGPGSEIIVLLIHQPNGSFRNDRNLFLNIQFSQSFINSGEGKCL